MWRRCSAGKWRKRTSEEAADETDSGLTVVAGHSGDAAAGAVVEEEIEEEEADLAHYVDELEEDAAFEELEEETHAAGEHEQPPAGNRGLRGTVIGRCSAVFRRTDFFGRGGRSCG